MGIFDFLKGRNKKNNNNDISRVSWDETEDIGIVTHFKGKPYTGICYSLFKNGKIEQECEMVDGLKHGKLTDYYENGNIKTVCSYKDDEIEGIVKYYDEEGNLDSDSYFKNGNRDGISRSYYKNGKLKNEMFFKNNDIYGEMKEFDENGILKETRNYKKNEVLQKNYGDRGELQHLLILKYGKDGKVDDENFTQKDYYENGTLKSSVVIKKSKLNGVCKFYYTNGQLMHEGNYKNDKRHGYYKSFDKNGSLAQETNFTNGKDDKETGNQCSECDISIKPEASCCTPCSYVVAQRMKEIAQTPITETDYYKESKEAFDKLSEDEKKKSKERFDSFMEEQMKKFDDLPEFSYTTNDFFEPLDEKVDDTFTGQCESQCEEEIEANDGEFISLIKGEYKNGVRHGKFQTLYENGSVHGERTYENGQENGVRSQYFYNGKLQIKSYVKNNLRQGIEEQYYESGMIKFKDNYKDDKLEGICFGYFENGQISSIEQFKNNKKIGPGITYPKVPESFIDKTNSHITRASSLQTTTLLKKVNVDWLPEIDVFDGSSLADISLDKLRDKEDRYLLLNVPITPDSKKKGIMIGVKEIIDEEHKVFGIPLAKFLIDGLVSFLERNHSFQLVDEDGVYGYISEKLMITLAKEGDIITILPTNDEMRSMLTSNKK